MYLCRGYMWNKMISKLVQTSLTSVWNNLNFISACRNLPEITVVNLNNTASSPAVQRKHCCIDDMFISTMTWIRVDIQQYNCFPSTDFTVSGSWLLLRWQLPQPTQSADNSEAELLHVNSCKAMDCYYEAFSSRSACLTTVCCLPRWGQRVQKFWLSLTL